jgi:osmotically inducible lipoprotein OsmB
MQTRAPGQVSFFAVSTISLRMLLGVSLVLSIGACTMSETQQRVGSGAAMGAAAGALLGGRDGAMVGAAVGAGGGYLVDQQKKRESSEAENQRLREENYRLRQQQ